MRCAVAVALTLAQGKLPAQRACARMAQPPPTMPVLDSRLQPLLGKRVRREGFALPASSRHVAGATPHRLDGERLGARIPPRQYLYAEKHGYQFYYYHYTDASLHAACSVNGRGRGARHASWCKLLVVADVLERDAAMDSPMQGVLWMDT